MSLRSSPLGPERAPAAHRSRTFGVAGGPENAGAAATLPQGQGHARTTEVILHPRSIGVHVPAQCRVQPFAHP